MKSDRPTEKHSFQGRGLLYLSRELDSNPGSRTHTMASNAGRRLASLLIVAGLFCVPAYLPAQIVQGQVVDSISEMPVARGFVVLLDSIGNEVARSIAGGDGTFTLRAPTGGLYRLRSERIGFRAFLSDSLSLQDGETVDLSLRVEALPIRLGSVIVPGNKRCTTNPEQSANTVIVWEEIRKALEATVWGEEQELSHYRQYSYRRELNGRRDRIASESLTTKSGLAEAPFSSSPPEQLAREGYIVERDDGAWYYVPDAQTLLDTQFLDTHCFHVVRDARHRPGQVGLAFAPMSDRRLADVEGALWLDEASSELRELEVRHTGVRYNIRDRRIGGTVKFMMLPSGAWIVREWQVRTPVFTMTDDPHRIPRHSGRVAGFTDTGGEIYEIFTRDGTKVYQAPVATVFGTVFDSTSGTHLAGVFVTVVGSDFRTHTDSAGRFELGVPLDGEYTLSLNHPRLDSVATPDQLENVKLARGSSTEVTFAIPHVRSNLRRHCGSSVLSRENGVIFGVVRASGSGAPTNGAKVSASWQSIDLSSRVGVVRNFHEEINTDDSGFYAICDVPAGRRIALMAEKDGTTSREASLIFPKRLGGTLSIGWERRPGEPYEQGYPALENVWKVDLTVGDPHQEAVGTYSSVLHGLVTDFTSGEPLAGVSVVVNDSQRTVSDADGTYQVVDVVWQQHGNQIEFLRLGYAPAVLEVQANSPTDGELLLNASLARSAIQLEGVTVEGERIVGLGDFARRSRSGMGDYITREDIEKRNPPIVTELLRTVPGLMVTPSDAGNYVTVHRRADPLTGSSRCRPAIILDGIRLSTVTRQKMTFGTLDAGEGDIFQGRDIGIDDLVDPNDVVGIEVYKGPSTVPVELSMVNTDCGVIVIWTRRR